MRQGRTKFSCHPIDDDRCFADCSYAAWLSYCVRSIRHNYRVIGRSRVATAKYSPYFVSWQELIDYCFRRVDFSYWVAPTRNSCRLSLGCAFNAVIGRLRASGNGGEQEEGGDKCGFHGVTFRITIIAPRCNDAVVAAPAIPANFLLFSDKLDEAFKLADV